MSARRLVTAMTIDRGSDLREILPVLTRALDGDGPAILPLSASDPRSPDIARSLGAGAPLDGGEDDPADPTAFVLATSGSTGTPKGVLLSAAMLAASAAATEERLGGPGHWLLTLPPHHVAGLQVLLRAARAGMPPVVMDGDAPFTAASFRAAAAHVPGPRRYVSLVPTQLRRVLGDADAVDAAAGFNAILVGGAATPEPLRAAARAAGLTVVTTYGMTETCGGCVYDGVPLAGVTACTGADGALRLSGPMVARGYRGRPRDRAFAHPGTFVTADTGTVGADGSVHVTGRVDDIIVSGGENIAPAPVEAAIAALPGVSDVLVVGVPDARWGRAVCALIVPDAGATWDVTRLRRALPDLPAAHRPQRALAVEAIPLLPSGKPDRAAARRLAAATISTVV